MIQSCPECNGKVSTEARACPHCGAPRLREGWRTIEEFESKPSAPPPAPHHTAAPARRFNRYSMQPHAQSLAPMFILITFPLLLAVGVVVAIQTAWLSAMGLRAFAVFGLVWTAICIAELFAVPMTARARGRDAGVWFLVTVIWLFFDTFLAVFAHLAGFVVFTSIMQAREGKVNPGTILAGILGVLIAGFFVYLPLWVLMLSSSRVDNKLQSYLRRRRRVS